MVSFNTSFVIPAMCTDILVSHEEGLASVKLDDNQLVSLIGVVATNLSISIHSRLVVTM